MAREPYRPISGPSAITPVARPVDTYVRPAEPPRSSLHELAEGLASLDTGMSAFLAKRNAKAEEQDKIRAEAAFNANNSLGWAEAVRQGKVPAHASPIFMQSYKAAQGNLAGIQLRDQFTKEYLSWDGRSKNDPQAFQAFLGEFVSKNIGTDDVDILRGLNPHIEALKSDAYEVFSSESAKSVYSGAISTRGAILGRTLEAASDDELTTGQTIDHEALWGDLMEQRRVALEAGTRAEDFDGQLVEIITSKAVSLNNPDLLGLLDRTTDEAGLPLKDYPKFGSLKDEAINALETTGRQRMLDRDRAQEKADKEREKAVVVSVARTIAQDPSAEIPEEVLREWEKYNPKARKDLVELRKSLLDGEDLEDPSEILRLHRDVAEGADREEILAAAAAGKIRNPQTLTGLLDRVEKYQKARREGGGMIESQTSKRFVKEISRRTAPDGLEADLFGNFATTDEGLQAIQDFEFGLMSWEEKNPDASLIERERYANELGEVILNRINPDADAMDPTKYTGDADLAQQKALEQTSQEPQADINSLYQGDQPPAYETLPKAFQQYLDREAGAMGITRDELNAAIWSETKGTDTEAQQRDLEAAPQVDPETGLIVPPEQGDTGGDMSELADSLGSLIDGYVSGEEPAAVTATEEVGDLRPFLDILGKAEGTDKGRGYNETLGYGAYTGGPVELTKMTLGEVKELQRNMLTHPDNSWNSSAVGRYQIVGKTLRSLQQQMGLPDDAVFDERLQDAMAIQLIKGRGYDAWRNGEIGNGAFLTALAQEWASLPTARGQGFYPNQRAAVDKSTVMSAFAGLKGLSAGQEAIDSILTDNGPQEVPPAYAKIPEDEVEQFLQWNPDPVGNHESNLQTIKPQLADVVRRAQELAGVRFVVGSGKRAADLQKKAVEWGWSQTNESNHLEGDAVDLWPIDEEGAVVFDEDMQEAIAQAMKQAAEELGVTIGWGGDWKRWKDRPHFELKKART